MAVVLLDRSEDRNSRPERCFFRVGLRLVLIAWQGTTQDVGQGSVLQFFRFRLMVAVVPLSGLACS
ncbi:hypothetical protein, partial [Sedimenticola selenatireducens]|uniref:hypothetical protein n=1 Tax=Sedimenticola selenatireducens TaxID=191960 RepID=UPI003F4AA428